MSLDWHRFVIAEDRGQVIGIGQVKPHDDGSRELASIAVIPERRGQGIGGEIIRTLLAKESTDVYLTCRSQLETYYTRFGFRRIDRDEMTPFFKKISRAVNMFSQVARGGIKVIVMKRSRPGRFPKTFQVSSGDTK